VGGAGEGSLSELVLQFSPPRVGTSVLGVEGVQGSLDGFRHGQARGYRFDAACRYPADLPSIGLVEALRGPIAARRALANGPHRDASTAPGQPFHEFIESTDVHPVANPTGRDRRDRIGAAKWPAWAHLRSNPILESDACRLEDCPSRKNAAMLRSVTSTTRRTR